MNNILVGIIIVCIILVLLLQIIKNSLLNKLNKALASDSMDVLQQITSKTLNQRILTPYVCDLYMLRGLYKCGDIDGLKEYLNDVLTASYSLEKRKDILDIYYYQFLFRDDEEYSGTLLERIKETNDLAYIEYNTNAYEVMIHKRTDLIDEMIQGIDDKKYRGLGLGITLYMVGMQYVYLDDKKNARIYFYNSLSCFHAKSIYAAHAKTWVDRLTDEMDVENLDY